MNLAAAQTELAAKIAAADAMIDALAGHLLERRGASDAEKGTTDIGTPPSRWLKAVPRPPKKAQCGSNMTESSATSPTAAVSFECRKMRRMI